MTTGVPSLHVRHQAVGRAEIDADHLTHAQCPVESGDLALDRGQQVVDVVALEQALAQGVRAWRAARLRRHRRQRVPPLAQLRQLRARARRAAPRSGLRAVSSRAPRRPASAPLRATRESRRAARSARTLPRAGRRHLRLPPSDLASAPGLRWPAGARCGRPGSAACGTRRSGTTTARGWPAVRPVARCRRSPGETCRLRSRNRRSRSCASRPSRRGTPRKAK